MNECPYCSHECNKFEDYGRITLKSFNDIPIPEVIASRFKRELNKFSIPPEVLRAFSPKREAIAYRGQIYRKESEKEVYTISKDLTSIVHGAIAIPEIKGTLKELRAAVGKIITKRQLNSIPGFSGDIDYRDHILSLKIINTGQDKEDADERGNTASVVLRGDISERYGAGISQELATIQYGIDYIRLSSLPLPR